MHPSDPNHYHYQQQQYQYVQQHQGWYPPMPPPAPVQTSMDLLKVVGLNFGIFFIYQVLLAFALQEAFILLDWMACGIHLIVSLIMMAVSFGRGKKMYGFGHLISIGIVIVLGLASMFFIAEVVGTPNLHF